MADNSREVAEGRRYQGEDESIVYTLDVSAIGSTPSSVSVAVKDWTNGTGVTSTVMPTNSPTVNSNVITLSPLKLLDIGTLYRVEVKYTISGNILESYFYVQGQE
jgi:hypothetical protein